MAVQASINAENAIPCSTDSQMGYPALTCQFQASNLTCLIGPHRSQLRTYLQMLAGFSKPRQGVIKINGQLVSEFDQLEWQKFRQQIGYLSGVAPLLSVQHGLMNVMLPALYHLNTPFRETAGKARALLKELQCDFELTRYPASLTSFQQLQLSLARALILEPSVLFLDVPFNDLGAREREKMAALLEKHQQNRVVCMIGGLQYPRFIEKHAKQIIYISEHKVMSFSGWESFLQTNDSEVKELLRVL